jgi:hypothetical protein
VRLSLRGLEQLAYVVGKPLTGKFSAATDMLQSKLKKVDLPTFGRPGGGQGPSSSDATGRAGPPPTNYAHLDVVAGPTKHHLLDRFFLLGRHLIATTTCKMKRKNSRKG